MVMDTNPKLEAGCFVVILQSEDLEEERRGDEVVEDCCRAKSDVGVKGFLRWIWLHLGWKSPGRRWIQSAGAAESSSGCVGR
jgi:hypothetical protein